MREILRHVFVLIVHLVIVICLTKACLEAKSSHQYPSSLIQLVPYPKQVTLGNTEAGRSTKVCYKPGSSVDISFINHNDKDINQECKQIIDHAMTRYKNYMTIAPGIQSVRSDKKFNNKAFDMMTSGTGNDIYDDITITKLQIEYNIQDMMNCETSQMHLMNEKYKILLYPKDIEGDSLKVVIYAESIWGYLRSLETLHQVPQPVFDSNFEWKYCLQDILQIEDEPEYSWRGLMIDISRHYLPMSTIEQIIDGMSFDKLNVLHLHLVDAVTFPIFIPSIVSSPKDLLVFNDDMELYYTLDDLKHIVQYSKERGIRVVPEIDMPGHAYSWKQFGSNITAYCPRFEANINNIPLNPVNENVYKVIKSIIDAMKQVFPDKYFHIGADELVKSCWRSDEKIMNYARDVLHITEMDDLWAYFQKRLDEENFDSPDGKVMVSWEEAALVLNSSIYQMPKDRSLIQVWRDPKDTLTLAQLGYDVLFSAPFYLDKQTPLDNGMEKQLPVWLWLDNWKQMYGAPLKQYANQSLLQSESGDYTASQDHEQDLYKRIVGGEACAWGEQIDPTTITVRLWPRLSAIAERLWISQPYEPFQHDEQTSFFVKIQNLNAYVEPRMMYHRCYHIAKRGIRSSPLRPDFCPYSFQFDTFQAQPLLERQREQLLSQFRSKETTYIVAIIIISIFAILFGGIFAVVVTTFVIRKAGISSQESRAGFHQMH